jgi:hypothetical protein
MLSKTTPRFWGVVFDSVNMFPEIDNQCRKNLGQSVLFLSAKLFEGTTSMTTQSTSNWRVTTSLCLLLLVVYLLYQLGFTSGFQFDDASSIGDVSAVKDIETALSYIFGGTAGQLGRPLSLLTFALQKDSWPEDPAAFFRVNTLIHLCNGVLVYWLSCLLAKHLPVGSSRDRWFALVVTALWLTLPLHVSANLAAVQRMTTLSSLFMLMGLIGYLSGRALLSQSPMRAYGLMSVSVVTGTILAILSKENGVLLPFYVLVLEVFIQAFATAPLSRNFKRWRWLFLGAPVLVVAMYFAYKMPHYVATYAIRDFNLPERLMTESRILWDYLRQIFIPLRGGTGLYHDDYPVSRSLSELTVIAAILGWLLLFAWAWVLRKRLPVLLFALLWFFAGHLIESTFIPLELYFEHRNYLAAFGPIFALCAMIWQMQGRLRYFARGMLALILSLNLFVLSEATSLWGDPLVAARVWTEEHPHSPRAAQYLARVYYHAGDPVAMRTATLEGYRRNPNNISLALQSVNLSCPHDSEAETVARIKQLEPVLRAGLGGATGVENINQMITAMQHGKCPYLKYEYLQSMADLLLENKFNQANHTIMAALHALKYKLYALQGMPNRSYQELLLAFSLKKELDIALFAGRVAAREGYPDEALKFLENALTYAPGNLVHRRKWEKEIGALIDNIEQEKSILLKGRSTP